MVNSGRPGSRYDQVSKLLKEMEAICYGVYFEILVEPKVKNEEGASYIITTPTNKAAEELVITLHDQLNRIDQLHKYYTKLLQIAKDTFYRAQREYNQKQFNVSLVKRNTFVSSKLHFVLTEPLVIFQKGELRRQTFERKVNDMFFQVKSVCDDVFFDPEKVEERDLNSKVIELKEMRAPYKGKSLRRNKTDELYRTTQL